MAKAKPAKSSKAQTSSPSKNKTRAAAAAPAQIAASENSTPFTGIAIGHTAGDVWGYLSAGEPRTIAEIKKSIPGSSDLVVAAIGWLAREDKLEFVTSGKTVKIGLR